MRCRATSQDPSPFGESYNTVVKKGMFDAVPKGKESEPSRSNLRRRRSGLTLSRLAATPYRKFVLWSRRIPCLPELQKGSGNREPRQKKPSTGTRMYPPLVHIRATGPARETLTPQNNRAFSNTDVSHPPRQHIRLEARPEWPYIILVLTAVN